MNVEAVNNQYFMLYLIPLVLWVVVGIILFFQVISKTDENKEDVTARLYLFAACCGLFPLMIVILVHITDLWKGCRIQEKIAKWLDESQ